MSDRSYRDAAVPPRLSLAGLAAGAPALSALAEAPHAWALFLDIDGTLLDIAPTPEAVVVPAGLLHDLSGVMAGLGGALALVTGRGVRFVDELFHPYRFPLAGLHGAELRLDDERTVTIALTPAFQQAKEALRAGTDGKTGIILEDKGSAIAVHYRLAPHRQEYVEALMRDAARLAGPGWSLQRGKMLVELKPAGADKGAALASFMESAPFAGRRPLAIGDDLTDENMFSAAIARGGEAIRIGSGDARTLASGRIGSPTRLRETLAALARLINPGA